MTNDTHTFAWNGIAFDVPHDWNLSAQHTFKGVTNIAMEDDVSVRLHLEWTVPRHKVDTDTVRKHYAKASTKLIEAAEKSFPIKGVPQGWSAIRYKMPDARELLIAYYLDPQRRVFCFFQFHFARDAVPRPLPTLRLVTSTFRVSDGPVVPWCVYDIAFELDRNYTLSMSALMAGQKLLVFESRFRRIFVWNVSLADRIMRKKSLPQWAADHLNGFKPIRAVAFSASANGELHAERKWRYPFGHYEEIGRMCFKYHAEYWHVESRNQLVILLAHYRRDDDLPKILDSFKILEDG